MHKFSQRASRSTIKVSGRRIRASPPLIPVRRFAPTQQQQITLKRLLYEQQEKEMEVNEKRRWKQKRFGGKLSGVKRERGWGSHE